MRSPFPGMDPYIEASGLWGNFHQRLIGGIEDQLNQLLPSRYVARSGERTYVEYADSNDELLRRHIEADVQVRTAPHAPAGSPATATVAEAAAYSVEIPGVIVEEFREIFLEILDLDRGRELVTCIEALSPSNKRYGSIGWELYNRKRQVFFHGHANFVEIDLLRRGQRMPMGGPLPKQPYYLLVLRKERAPLTTVYPAHYREPLPAIPIPLRPPDADVALSLQPLIDAIYIRGRYSSDIDYQKPLRPPLEPTDAAWLQERLREQQPVL